MTLKHAFVGGLCLWGASLTFAGGGDWLYTVRAGDTLIDIAAAYVKPSAGWEKLQSINNVPDPKRLQPASTIRIPLELLRRDAGVAEVLHVQGEVHSLSEKGQAARIEAGTTLQVGDSVQTGVGSSASLRFADGSRLLVSEKSKVQMSNLLVFGKTGMADTRIRVESGTVETQVAKQKGSAAKYEVKAPTMNLGVRGTDFRVRVDESSGVTRSEVLEGKVAANAQRREVLLKAGFATSAGAGEVPRAPKPLLPAPDVRQVPELLDRVPLRFSWPAVSGAVAYRAQVFAGESAEQLLLDGVFPSNAAKWVDLPDGQYQFRVRAIDGQGFEGMNANRGFALKARPEPPFILQPQDGGKAYGDQLQMKWSKAAVAQAYRLQVSAKADFSSLLLDQDKLGETDFEMPLIPGQYFWRIASITSAGETGPFSDVIAFEQRPIPASPELEAPTMDADNLAFGWKAGSGGESYQFQFARDAGFSEILHDLTTKESKVKIPRPDGGDYFMRVKTIDADGFAGNFGPVQNIEVPYSRLWWLLLVPAAYLLVL